MRDICAMYPDECALLSCDSNAKVHIGGQAVSRYQLCHFSPDEYQARFKEHDFPTSGYLKEPDCYLEIQRQALESESEASIKD